MDDIACQDEAREEDEDTDFLDVTVLGNEVTSILILEKRDKGSIVLPWTKRKDQPLMMWMRPG